LKFFKLENKIKLLHYILKSHSHVLFYALLFASSCRSKRNYPAAETLRYYSNSYIAILGCKTQGKKKNMSLPAYWFIYSEIAVDFTAKGLWRKRLRPFIRQRLNTTGWVVRNAGQNHLYGTSFNSNKSGFILAKGRIYLQTRGAPFAIHLITVYYSHLKTVQITFGSLNASNQGCDIEITLSFGTFPNMLGFSHGYLSVSFRAATAIQSIFIVFCQHTSGKFYAL
jgi:hypothetical protein